MKIINVLILLFISLLPCNCSSQTLDYAKETKFGNFRYCKNDVNTINDLINATETNLPGICAELNLKLNNPITVEIYPSQEEYNKNIMNPDLRNSPAVSGSGKIQIVSPSAKIKIDSMTYEDRLMLLIHEYVHILIDNLEKTPPIFIDEGIASFYSSYGFYKSAAAKYVKQINFIPSIEQLLEDYNEITAPDLFSFIFIDFIVKLKGREILSEILRKSDFLVKEDLNLSWKRFVEQNYY